MPDRENSTDVKELKSSEAATSTQEGNQTISPVGGNEELLAGSREDVEDTASGALDDADLDAVNHAGQLDAVRGSSTNLMFYVGIGASAGGLEALQEFCQNLPEHANIAYIIAQHLSPKHRSMLGELIQRKVELKVQDIQSGIKPRANCIYITPPNTNVIFEAGRLRLRKPDEGHLPKPSVDLLFSSLATAVGRQSIGVVLSGTGHDGARGIRAIRAAGGITFAQDITSAKYEGMPAAAIDTDCVDMVASPKDIAHQLEKLAMSLPLQQPIIDGVKEADSENFRHLIEAIHKQTGVNFRKYKKPTLGRRIERRMLARQIAQFADYVDFAVDDPVELETLFKDILISVTEFYRDRQAFDTLRRSIRALLDRKDKTDPVRIWIVGCATGEEVYTVAMLFALEAGSIAELVTRNIQFFGSDIDVDALAIARKGVYPDSALQTLPVEMREKFFTSSGTNSEVIKPLKDLILFTRHNILEDPPFMRIDMVSCRNILIYFEAELQSRVYNTLHYAMAEEGILFLGKSESTSQAGELFSTVDTKAKIYRKRMQVHGDHHRFSKVTSFRSPKVKAVSEEVHPGSRALFEALAKQVANAAVLVNGNLSIEYAYGSISRFLSVKPGRPELNLVDLVSDIHRDELRALVYKSQRTGECIEGQIRKSKIEGVLQRTQIKVFPLDLGDKSASFLFVAFNILGPVESEKESSRESVSDEQIAELQDELSAAREHLQTVIEELETSNEELQSLNEELQSANEELQSTNEELETSNEELQSTNEELVTVNDELSHKTGELERSRTELLNIKESLAFPLIVIDRRFRIRSFNKVAKKHFNISEENEFLHSLLPEFCKPKKVKELAYQVVDKGEPKFIGLDSEGCSYYLEITPYRQPDGRVEGAVCSFLDHTEVRRQQKQLSASEAKLRGIIDNSAAPIGIKTMDGKYVDANESLYSLFGLTRDAFIGKGDYDLFNDYEAAELERLDKLVLKEDKLIVREVSLHIDEVHRTFVLAKYPQRDSNGRTDAICIMATDITERKQIEDRMVKARQEAERANLAKSEFLANMSHEIRTPMNAIFGVVSIINSMDVPKEKRDVLFNTLSVSVDELKQLIDELLDFSKLEAGKIELESEPFSPRETVERVSNIIRVKADEKKLHFKLSIKADLPAILVGDELRLRQVLSNLLSNAVKFTSAGSVTLDIDGHISGSQFILRCAITDTGIGIPKSKFDRIFDKFSQADPSISRLYGGTGLGLSITKEILQLMDGGFELESNEGVGTTFRVYMPFELPENSDYCLTPDIEVVSEPIFTSTSEAELNPILVVEDKQSNLTILSTYLDQLGCQYTLEQLPAKALEQLKDTVFSIILLDLQMEGMNGFEFVEAMNKLQLEDRSTPPVIAVTGHVHDEIREKCKAIGMVDFLPKPLELDKLRAALVKVLSGAK